MSELVPIESLPDRVPEWPLSPWATAKRCRLKELTHVKIGRRVYVTREWLAEYLSARQVTRKTG